MQALAAALVSFFSTITVVWVFSSLLDAYATRTAIIEGKPIRFARDSHGVLHSWGDHEEDFALALGYAHARDRGLQLFFTRVVAEGRLSELFLPTPESIKMDKVVRRNAFHKRVAQEEAMLSKEARAYLMSYAAGINAYLAHHVRPWPFFLVGYKPEPWKISDTILMAKLMGWLGLASVHSEAEKLVLDLLQLGSKGQSFVTSLFHPFISPLDPPLLAAIRSTNLSHPFFPPKLRDLLPSITASNNWAVGAARTANGKAILASDPHLPVDRLPAFWVEFVMHLPSEDFRMGVTLPGMPGLWMGRTRHLAWGFTYGFADVVDYFIEDIEGEKYLRDGKWINLERDDVEIKLKGLDPIRLVQYHTIHGILETDGESLVNSKRTFRLAISYSPSYRSKITNPEQTQFSSIDSLIYMPQAKTVKEAKEVLQRCNVELSANFLLADSTGAIGYQQTGWIPIRPQGQQGILPLPGWNSAFDWQGIYPGHRLRSDDDVSGSGVMATANNNMQSTKTGAPLTLNFHMGPNRVDRILELLAEKQKHTVKDMQRMQADLISAHARLYMEVLRPILDRSDPLERLLAEWDLSYSADSRAATFFEEFYEQLVVEVIGRVTGVEAAAHYTTQTPMLMLYNFFDRLVLSHDSSLNDLLWRNQSLNDLLLSVMRNTKSRQPITSLPRFGQVREIRMRNIFFGDKLPFAELMGIEERTILLGSRGSIVQGQLRVRQDNMMTRYNDVFNKAGIHPPGMGTGGVSYRLITDFDEPFTMYTALPGGPSDDPLSVFYSNDLHRWEKFQYKILDARFMEAR